MSKALEAWIKSGTALGMQGETLRVWCEEKHKEELEEKRKLVELEEKRRLVELEEKRKLVELEEKRRLVELEEKRRVEELQERKRKEEIELEEKRRLAELEEKRRLTELEEKQKHEERSFQLEQIRIEHEYKMCLARLEAEKQESAKTTAEGNSNILEHRGSKDAHSKVRVPQLVPEKDEIPSWFCRFENIATMSELPEKYWATKVTQFFDSETIKTVFSLDEESRADYQTVKKAVLDKYQYTPEGNRLKFCNFNPPGKMTFKEYVSTLLRLFGSWVKSTEIDQSFDKLTELVVMGKVLDTVDPRIYSYLIQQKPQTISEFIELGNNFCEAFTITRINKPQIQTVQAGMSQATFHSVKQNQPKSNNQQKKGNFSSNKGGSFPGGSSKQSNSANFREGQRNYQPNQGGRFQNVSDNRRQQYQPTEKRRFAGPNDQQYNRRTERGDTGADRPGNRPFFNNRRNYYGNSLEIQDDEPGSTVNHVAACAVLMPQINTDTLVGGSTPLKLGEHGLQVASLARDSHGSLNLENAIVNNQPTTMIRDSAATLIGVDQALVSPKDKTGEIVKCVTFGGTVEYYDVCYIDLESPYITGRYQAVILPQPCVPLTLGNLPGIKSPSPEEIADWNCRHGFGKTSNSPIQQSTSLNRQRLGQQDDPVKQIPTGMIVQGKANKANQDTTRLCSVSEDDYRHRNTSVFRGNSKRETVDDTRHGRGSCVRDSTYARLHRNEQPRMGRHSKRWNRKARSQSTDASEETVIRHSDRIGNKSRITDIRHLENEQKVHRHAPHSSLVRRRMYSSQRKQNEWMHREDTDASASTIKDPRNGCPKYLSAKDFKNSEVPLNNVICGHQIIDKDSTQDDPATGTNKTGSQNSNYSHAQQKPVKQHNEDSLISKPHVLLGEGAHAQKPLETTEDSANSSTPQVRRGQRDRKPRKEWPEEDFHTSLKRKAGSHNVDVTVHIEPITRSNRAQDTNDGNHTIPQPTLQNRGSAEVPPSSPTRPPQMNVVDEARMAEQKKITQDIDGATDIPPQTFSKAKLFRETQENATSLQELLQKAKSSKPGFPEVVRSFNRMRDTDYRLLQREDVSTRPPLYIMEGTPRVGVQKIHYRIEERRVQSTPHVRDWQSQNTFEDSRPGKPQPLIRKEWNNGQARRNWTVKDFYFNEKTAKSIAQEKPITFCYGRKEGVRRHDPLEEKMLRTSTPHIARIRQHHRIRPEEDFYSADNKSMDMYEVRSVMHNVPFAGHNMKRPQNTPRQRCNDESGHFRQMKRPGNSGGPYRNRNRRIHSSSPVFTSSTCEHHRQGINMEERRHESPRETVLQGERPSWTLTACGLPLISDFMRGL